MRTIILLLLFVVLPTWGAPPSPPALSGTVFVYRYKRWTRHAAKPLLFCDGQQIAPISNGTRLRLPLTPGKHELRLSDRRNRLELDVKLDSEYYVRLEAVEGVTPRLVLVPPAQAAYELKQTKPLAAKCLTSFAPVSR
jgi:hypothetical protein